MAQLDRASDFGSDGWGFESLRARQIQNTKVYRNMNRYILTLSCPDQKGILATVSHRLFEIGGNILENAQCTEMKSDTFCMRTCFEIDDVGLDKIKSAIGEVASELFR